MSINFQGLSKLRRPKPMAISVTIVVAAFVAGLALAAQPQTPTQKFQQTGALSTNPANTLTTTVNKQAQVSSAPTPKSGSSTSSPTSASSPVSTSPTPTPEQQTSTAVNTAPAAQPVTAVSAVIGSWQDGNNSYCDANTGQCATAQVKYCTFGYSNGSQKQVLYQTAELVNNATITNQSAPLTTCSVASAPTGN